MNPLLIALCPFVLLDFVAGVECSFRCRWEAFKRQYRKYYLSQAEEELRFSIFQSNIRNLQRQPKNAKSKNTWHIAGVNQNSDMTASEPIWKLYKGRTLEERARFAFLDALKAHNTTKSESGGRSWKLLPRSLNPLLLQLKYALALLAEAAKHVHGEKKPHPSDSGNLDLRDCFLPARHQGQCGSCYAFSSVALLECALYKETGKHVALSEQMVLDCTKKPNLGCRGGWAHRVFDWVIKNGGISRAKDYPYTATDTGKCEFKPEKAEVTSMQYDKVEPGTEDELKKALDTYGPVAISMDAAGKKFAHFSGKGIYSNKRCSSKKTNHAVVVSGYGTYKGVDYWLIRNSYGPKWGENGYIKVPRNKSNMCGVATRAHYIFSINEGS